VSAIAEKILGAKQRLNGMTLNIQKKPPSAHQEGVGPWDALEPSYKLPVCLLSPLAAAIISAARWSTEV